MYIGYVLYYFTRKNITVAIPGMMDSLGYTMTDLGWMLTLSSLMYGLSKFTSGMISDRSNARYFMAFGLIVTGLLNIIFGLSSSIILFGLLWAANGFFQGWGWPPCSRLLMHWYGKKERARWWAVWNTSHNLGGAVIPILATWFILWFNGWQAALYIPGIMAIAGGLFLINRLRDTPQSLGLPPIEEHVGEEVKESEEEELTTRQILFKYVLTNKFIWILAAANFAVYVVRQAVNDWSFVYLTQGLDYSPAIAGTCVGIFEIGGLFGSLAAGWLSDLVFKGKRGPVSVLFSLGIGCAVAGFWFASSSSSLLTMMAMFGIGFFIFGPQMLIGIACAELSHKKASATSTGFAGFFAYAGAAAAGAPIAHVAQNYGWNVFFMTVIGCSIACVALLMPLWGATHRDDSGLEAEAA